MAVANRRDPVADLVERISALKPRGRRALVAIAGAPASGKSTMASQLARVLNAGAGGAVVVPMDGFHLDNQILTARGLLPRKGAPETFDAHGFIACIRRLTAEPEVIVPVFDRTRDIAIAGAQAVGPEDRICLVEGNYLLFDEDPWRALTPLWDLRIRIDVPVAELERRLVRRWLNHGLDDAAARARAGGNDIPNAHRVAGAALPADVTVKGN